MARPQAVTREAAAADAADYFDLHIAPGHVASGMPKDGLTYLRRTYIRDIATRPHLWADVAAELPPEEA